MKPIIFSTDMVRAILDGCKTQTRRVVKPQPESRPILCTNVTNKGRPTWVSKTQCGSLHQISPYQPGDILWVRETWAEYVPGCPPPRGFSYRADHNDPKGDGPANPMKWRPSIHMPREAARLLLEVQSVRVQRVQDISEEDAIAEGAVKAYPTTEGYFLESEQGTYRGGFSALWDSLNAKKGFGWDANPYVWAVLFKRCEGVAP